MYTQVLLVEKENFLVSSIEFLSEKTMSFSLMRFNLFYLPGRIISLCVKFQRRFLCERTLKMSTGSKATRETLEK